MLTQDEPFKSLTAERRAMIIHEQTLIATYEPEKALETLAILLKTPEERDLATRIVQYIPGAIGEMTPKTLELLQRFHKVLDLPPVTEDILEDPLEHEDGLHGAIANGAAAKSAEAGRRRRKPETARPEGGNEA